MLMSKRNFSIEFRDVMMEWTNWKFGKSRETRTSKNPLMYIQHPDFKHTHFLIRWRRDNWFSKSIYFLGMEIQLSHINRQNTHLYFYWHILAMCTHRTKWIIHNDLEQLHYVCVIFRHWFEKNCVKIRMVTTFMTTECCLIILDRLVLSFVVGISVCLHS